MSEKGEKGEEIAAEKVVLSPVATETETEAEAEQRQRQRQKEERSMEHTRAEQPQPEQPERVASDYRERAENYRHNDAFPIVIHNQEAILWCPDCGGFREILLIDGNKVLPKSPWIYARGRAYVVRRLERIARGLPVAGENPHLPAAAEEEEK